MLDSTLHRVPAAVAAALSTERPSLLSLGALPHLTPEEVGVNADLNAENDEG